MITTTPSKGGPRVNEDIDVPNVRLIGADGENIGVVTAREAMDLADEAGLDLVEISHYMTVGDDEPILSVNDDARAGIIGPAFIRRVLPSD